MERVRAFLGFPMINKLMTGRRLSLMMRANGMTPADIQAYLKLTCVQTVYRWLEGINIPSIDNLYALSRLFRVKMDDLVVGTGRSDRLAERRDRVTSYYILVERSVIA